MTSEWLLSAVIITIATPVFGHFEIVRPTWTRQGIEPITAEPGDRGGSFRSRPVHAGGKP